MIKTSSYELKCVQEAMRYRCISKYRLFVTQLDDSRAVDQVK